jgi:hypothetical protein
MMQRHGDESRIKQKDWGRLSERRAEFIVIEHR